MKMRHGVVVLALLALTAPSALNACAKQDGEGIPTANGQGGQAHNDPDKPSDNPEERVRQFVGCMRAEGIDVPDPEPGDATGKSALRFAHEGSIDKTKLSKAMEKCDRFMPGGGENVRLTPEQIDAQRAFAQCMRDNGHLDWPDPDPRTGGFGADFQVNKDDPNVRATIEKCRG